MNANKGNELEEDPTILQWMSINGKTDYETDSDAMAHRSVLLSVAASFTVADSLVFIFYDLCKHPEFIKELREEAEQCLISSGKWDRPTLDNMEKLESFMCESQRTNPSLLLTCRRRVMKPITLSDGLYLPRGTEIGMAAEEIANDPSVTPDPDKFDPFRSYRARQQPGEESKHRFSTTTANNLHFGYGTQACPGRQVALVVQKMVIASILIGWDIRYPEGQSIPGGIIMDDMQIPRTGIKIEARRRKIAPGVPRVGILD
ncbi:Ent-kaurene oxidase [Cytospora mali]|uniref:Ent-kaurene oxidase n=1 Tax=Cytospora mali TaxID=578113 RepID=A0A194W0Z6_CYTMA|nr:Ent-kaurene oxidase [Valsa mali]